MAMLLLCPTKDPQPWIEALTQVDPNLEIRVWPEDGDRTEVDFILTWAHPEGAFCNYPNLKCISSMGAGVDQLLCDITIPTGVEIARIVDPDLVIAMGDYVLTAVMHHVRDFQTYAVQQQQKTWQEVPPRSIRDFRVGVMGLGQIGQAVATRLQNLGFVTAGWSRSPKTMLSVATFHGEDQLGTFLSTTDILICLLPLTAQTQGILNYSILQQLPVGAYLINVARGGHLVESDLLSLVDQGHLAGACLDVFCEEPLPTDHPFWNHPKILVTPHIASLTNPVSVAPQVVENYRRSQANQPLLHQVDRNRGY